jgi:hypothetical protein
MGMYSLFLSVTFAASMFTESLPSNDDIPLCHVTVRYHEGCRAICRRGGTPFVLNEHSLMMYRPVRKTSTVATDSCRATSQHGRDVLSRGRTATPAPYVSIRFARTTKQRRSQARTDFKFPNIVGGAISWQTCVR